MNLPNTTPLIYQAADPLEFCVALLKKMTLEEKVGQMVQADLSWKQDVPQLLREGRIGSLLTIRDAVTINALQRIAVEETRLGIPVLMGNDIIHGYRTIFPIPLALASSWNLDLIEKIAKVSISEAAATGTTWNYSPMVDISRDPRWGRIAEGAGEDPFLGAEIARAWVRGIQSPSLPGEKRAAACVKHFAAYGAAESGKDYNTVDMSERRLRNEYLAPYKAAVEEGVLSVMTSFNELNGIPATANAFLLQQILRKEWGFDGVIVSDYDSVGELIYHGIAEDHKEAALLSMRAGVDVDMMGNGYHFHLADLVREGKISEKDVDQAVLRILMLKVKLDLFENPYVDEEAIASRLQKPEYMELAVRAAEQSIVLLKNKGQVLPLQPAGKTIAVIGPIATEQASLLGCWHFDGQPEETETVLENLRRSLPVGTNLVYEKGCAVNGRETDFSAAVLAANQADIILLTLGETEEMSGEAHSRSNLRLPGMQQALANAVFAAGKPVVAILFSGRPLVVSQLFEDVDALLMAWHGGSKAAQGLTNILLGKADPSARITASFPRSEGQIPVYYAHKATGRPYEANGTLQFNELHKSSYIDESNYPLFPFGYGLSYTTFAYSDLIVETPTISPVGVLRISAKVTNTGSREGQETVQCYLRDLVGSVTRPVKELKRFQKINLKPGESHTIHFEIAAAEMGFYGIDMEYVVEPGKFDIWIGPNSAEGLKRSFEIMKTESQVL